MLSTGAERLLALQRGLTGERLLAGTPYMDDPALAAAYSEYYLDVSKAQVGRVLALTGIRPRSVLDLGAGPGSVSLVLADVGATSFTLVDSSQKILAQARASLARIANANKREYSITTLTANLESPTAIPPGPFDLVAFGHCLNETGGNGNWLQERLAILRRAAMSLSSGGCMLVIEPATLKASRDTLMLRDALIAAGWSVLAPCTFHGSCPALAAGSNHTCHDEARWDVPPDVKRLAEKAGLDRDLIKMTWLLLRPPPPAPVTDKPPESDLYRVVSAPMLNKGGRVRYLLCGPGGRFPFSARKDDQAATRAGFFKLERYDLVRVYDPEQRENGWGFGLGTRIEYYSTKLWVT